MVKEVKARLNKQELIDLEVLYWHTEFNITEGTGGWGNLIAGMDVGNLGKQCLTLKGLELPELSWQLREEGIKRLRDDAC